MGQGGVQSKNGRPAPARITSRQQQTERTLLDWLREEYAIEKPSNKLLTVTELDSNTWVGEVKRIRGKKQPLSSAGLHALRDEYTRTIEPARALAAETFKGVVKGSVRENVMFLPDAIRSHERPMASQR